VTADNVRRRLDAIARRAMVEHGLEPDFPPAALAQSSQDVDAPLDGLRDLRALPWSSIDNEDSRDLDQAEVTIEDGGATRLLVAIADVDALVPRGSAVDDHAHRNTTSVYTPARVFPMLPEALSTERTSLNEAEDRAAIVIDMGVTADGAIAGAEVYRAAVRNHLRLDYERVAAWLDGAAPPRGLEGRPDIEAQLRRQDALARVLRKRRQDRGALDIDRVEVRPIVDDHGVHELRDVGGNRARDLIEDFMIAANSASASFLAARRSPSIRRVVRTPDRWPRIVELASTRGITLPAQPDAPALEAFVQRERRDDPEGFAELSLTIVKLLGRGEYAVASPGQDPGGHFALAVTRYTHSTAPNRRFPDLITQRLLKAAIRERHAAYSAGELESLAAHCTRQEDAANKVERQVRKAAMALWIAGRIGVTFDAIVTGASPKGTWVKVMHPPVEGRLEQGTAGLDVGDRIRVRLIHTDAERGFIDFARN
jgi:exoribonuclease-2